MTRTQNVFTCTQCDAQYPAWQGRCSECGAWGTIAAAAATRTPTKAHSAAPQLTRLDTVPSNAHAYQSTGIPEVDRVLSGGLVAGSLTLLGGNPGIGKSTLVLQIAASFAKQHTVLYVSGEESAEQLKLRYDRLRLAAPKLQLVTETNVQSIVSAIRKHTPAVAIIDSVQTLHDPNVPGEAGSVNHIKAVTINLLEAAKTTGTAVILVGHVTKEGVVAGPKTLEHLVDTVVYLEGDETQTFRLLRTVKHRFGVTDEVGVFEMTERGLQTVANPSEFFVQQNTITQPGAALTVVVEGTRPFLVEVQALVSPMMFGYPRRLASGYDKARLELLVAVLTKRARLQLANQDVHVNVIGGLRLRERAVDLAVAMAIASGLLDRPLPEKTVCLGEVGLSGEIRPVPLLKQRLTEAGKLGMRSVLLYDDTTKRRGATLTLCNAQTLQEALQQCFHTK